MTPKARLLVASQNVVRELVLVRSADDTSDSWNRKADRYGLREIN